MTQEIVENRRSRRARLGEDTDPLALLTPSPVPEAPEVPPAPAPAARAARPAKAPRPAKIRADQLPIGVAEDVMVTVKTGQYDKLKATMDIPSILIAPFKKGQQVGTLRVTLDGQPIQSVPLIALNDAPQGGFFSRLWDSILLWFHGSKKADAAAPAAVTDAK